MYDVNGNGWIDLVEMTNLVQSIYQAVQVESAEERARDILKQMDRDGDGRVCSDMLDRPEVDRATHTTYSVS